MHDTPYESLLDLIGETPVLHLKHLGEPGLADIFAKLETCNPGGSIKDRVALRMIADAEATGALGPGGTIIEPTAGNTGIGLAMVGVARGYRVVMVVPSGFSREKVLLMEALGAEVVRTPAEKRMKGAIDRAREIAADTAGAFVPQQFANPSNPAAHHDTTGAEIWRQMECRVDAVVIGAGTGGTFTGVARYVKERRPSCRAVLVEPQGSIFAGGEPGTHRVEGIGNSFWPEALDRSLIDEVITVSDVEAFDMVRRLAREEALLVGGSSGANVAAALQVARRLGGGGRVVTVVPDSMERYLSHGPAGDSEAQASQAAAPVEPVTTGEPG